MLLTYDEGVDIDMMIEDNDEVDNDGVDFHKDVDGS